MTLPATECRDGRDVVIVAVLAEEREGRERAISKDNKKRGLLYYNISVLHEKTAIFSYD
jgi:hypothetical protein